MRQPPRAGDLAILARWTLARLRLVGRTPRAAFFTFVFPLLFLVIFCATQGNNTVDVGGGKIHFAQFFTPSVGVFGLLTAGYTALIFGLATARDRGVLKRVRGTPVPAWCYLGAWLLSGAISGLAAVALMFVVAVPAFGVHIYLHTLPAAIVSAIVGGLCFSSLGIAMGSLVKNADSAPAVANLTLFPIMFLSGIFYPIDTAPRWVRTFAHIFPVNHIVQALGGAFSPLTRGSGFRWGHLGIAALWGAAGLALAVRRFSREMEGGEQRGGPAAAENPA